MKRFEKILFFITWFLLTSGFLTLFNLKSIIPSTLIEQDFNTIEFAILNLTQNVFVYTIICITACCILTFLLHMFIYLIIDICKSVIAIQKRNES